MGWLEDVWKWAFSGTGTSGLSDLGVDLGGSLGIPSDAAGEIADLFNNPPATGGGTGDPNFESIFSDANSQAAEDLAPIHELLGDKELGTGLYGDIANLPTFTEWMGERELGDTSGIQELINNLSGELGGLDPDSEEARAYAAAMAGFTDTLDENGNVVESAWDKRQAFVDNLLGIMGAQEGAGMSAEDMALQERAIRRNTAEMERRAERMIADSFSESGSMGRMFLQADEALGQIANVEVQQQAQLATDNRNLKFEQYMAAAEQYAQQYQQGNLSATDYVNTRRLALGDAISGYNTEMQAIFEANQEYFQAHAADYQVMVAQVQATFAAIQFELGLVMTEYEASSQIAAQALLEIYGPLEYQAMLDELGFDFSNVINLISAAGTIIGALSGGPIGSAIGGVIGETIEGAIGG